MCIWMNVSGRRRYILYNIGKKNGVKILWVENFNDNIYINYSFGS